MINSIKSPTKQLDFNDSIREILGNVGLYFPKKECQIFPRDLERAIKIRNRISHQYLELDRYDHDIECLSRIANGIGHSYISDLIRKRRKDQDIDFAPCGLVSCFSMRVVTQS